MPNKHLAELNNTQRDFMNTHCLGSAINFYDKNQAQRTGILKKAFVKNDKLYIRVSCYDQYTIAIDNIII